MSTVLEQIEQQIAKLSNKAVKKNTGNIRTVADGVAKIDGLSDVMYNEMVQFPGGAIGIALNLEADEVGCVIPVSYTHLPCSQSILADLGPMEGSGRDWRIVAFGRKRGRVLGGATYTLRHNAAHIGGFARRPYGNGLDPAGREKANQARCDRHGRRNRRHCPPSGPRRDTRRVPSKANRYRRPVFLQRKLVDWIPLQ